MNTNWLSMQIQLIAHLLPSPPAEISNNGTFYGIQAALVIDIDQGRMDRTLHL